MSKVFSSYRELLADALSPRPTERHADVLVVTKLQFKPSEAAVRRAEEVRQRVRSDMAQSTAKSES